MPRRYKSGYYAANRRRLRGYFQKYYRRNRRRILMRMAAYRAANREALRERQRNHNHKKTNAPMPTRIRPSACEICEKVPRGRVTVLGLDHCHETRRFRGWLCDKCNRGLGFFGDDLAGIMRAVRYLKRAAK